MTTEQTQTTTDPQARFRHWPDLTRWYGLSFVELSAMPNWARELYEESLPRIKAEELGRMIDASAFPQMQKKAQEKLIRRLNRDLNQGKKEEAETITDGEEYTKRVLGAGIGITAVDSEGNVIETVKVGGSTAPERPEPDETREVTPDA